MDSIIPLVNEEPLHGLPREAVESLLGDTQNLMGCPPLGEQRGWTKQSPAAPSHRSPLVIL